MLVTSQFYFIMDYSGNYYRTNAKDQLVVADSANEATVFTCTEANRRISAGVKNRFYCTIPADSEMDDGTNLLETDGKEEPVAEIINVADSPAKILIEAERPETVEKSISEYDLSKMDWQEYLTHFTFIVGGLKNYREELAKAESDMDQKIGDVLHYIELCETDEGEAGDLVNLLRVCRENRRTIKDEITRVDSFQRNLGTSANVVKAKETLKAIKGLETRKYTPRKYAALFEGSVFRTVETKRRQYDVVEDSADIEEPENMDGSKNIEGAKDTEETQMEWIRQETPFDGRENDWLKFAEQQAEFYKYAEQYIMNLQMDVNEIDDAIDALMQDIETANCNVTQGYKLFRRLKDLRIERRKKAVELEILYVLTDHFDINMLAVESENNVYDIEDIIYGKEETVENPVAEMEDEKVLDSREKDEQEPDDRGEDEMILNSCEKNAMTFDSSEKDEEMVAEELAG